LERTGTRRERGRERKGGRKKGRGEALLEFNFEKESKTKLHIKGAGICCSFYIYHIFINNRREKRKKNKKTKSKLTF
jgi:hypothetical protein